MSWNWSYVWAAYSMLITVAAGTLVVFAVVAGRRAAEQSYYLTRSLLQWARRTQAVEAVARAASTPLHKIVSRDITDALYYSRRLSNEVVKRLDTMRTAFEGMDPEDLRRLLTDGLDNVQELTGTAYEAALVSARQSYVREQCAS